jgi:hypothetical protein
MAGQCLFLWRSCRFVYGSNAGSLHVQCAPCNHCAAVQKLAMDRIRQDIGEYDVCKAAEDLDYEAVDMHIIADPLKAVESRDW